MNKLKEKEIKKFREKFGRFYYSDEVGMDWEKPKKQNITGGIPDKHSGFCIASDDIENIIIDSHNEIRKAEREKIKKDLLKIADKGEMEELRVEVERYFEIK